MIKVCATGLKKLIKILNLNECGITRLLTH